MGSISRKIARGIARKANDHPSPKLELSPKQQSEIDAKFAKMERREAGRRRKYGSVRPIVTGKFQGKRLVAVGSTLYWQDQEKWKTFPDFLVAHMWAALGRKWFESEIAKPEGDRHLILRWKKDQYDFTQSVEVDADGVYSVVLDAPSRAYFALAHDLYVVRNNAELQRRLVARLKHPDQFQGARYELAVTSTFIRAGFEIQFEVETDGTSQHNEFIATHRATGQRFVLEAKSRQRRGVFGFRGGNAEDRATMGVGVRGLLQSALSKPAPYPRVIFVDINFPPERLVTGPSRDAAMVEMDGTVRGLQLEGDASPWNVIVFTNYPYGYGGPGEAYGGDFAWRLTANRPACAIDHEEAVVALESSLRKVGNIPNEFPDDESEA